MMSVEDILRRLAVEEVGGHEELQRDLWRYGKLGDLGGAVGVAHLKEKHVRTRKASLVVLLRHSFFTVLRIRNVYPGSRIRLFSIPDPGSELSPLRIPDPL